MRCFKVVLAAALFIESVASTAWITKSVRATRRNNNSPASKGFVTLENGHFQLNGKPFYYLATNAYYLMQLSDDGIKATLEDIAKHNITVVRTWGFNDVLEIPATGAWIQAFLPNGTIFNEGVSGLQRLDTIVKVAKELGLKVQFVLTNNWNPQRPTTGATLMKRQTTTGTNTTHPPGFLSNDYGGMDTYVSGHGQIHHDTFFSNETIINAFNNFLQVVVSRYKDSNTVLAWELANDPRCNSTLPSSGTCTAQTVTRWHAQVAQTVKTIDPNHVIASGNQGFFCLDCPKLFPLVPRPQPSPAPGQKRRATGPLTKKRVLSLRRARAKRNMEAAKKRWASAVEKRTQGEKGKWSYRGKVRDVPHSVRQVTTQAVGPAFDGSQGVDSQDIINIPQIGFATFQLFPDQNIYGPGDPTLSAFENLVQNGIEWINLQAEAVLAFGKPLAMTGFGVVTQANLPSFTAFNTSQPFLSINSSTTQAVSLAPNNIGIEQGQIPINDMQQQTAYSDWINAAIAANVDAITHWQWGVVNLQPTVPTPPPTQQQTTFVPAFQQTTPNDGYSAISEDVKNILRNGALTQQTKNI